MSKKKKVFIAIILIVVVVGQHVLSEMGSLYSNKESKRMYGKFSYYDTKENVFVSPEELVFYPERTTGGSSGFLRFFSKSPNAPKHDLPKVNLTKADFSSTPSPYALYWLGHSSAVLELDGLRILIDPVLDNAAPFPGIVGRYSASPIKREELPEVDIVLISHDHYDHLEARTMKYLKNTNTRFIVPLGVGSRLIGWGIAKDKITEIAWDQSVTISSVRITATPTVHYSGRSGLDRNKTLWAAYVIKGREKNIFWSGDSGYGTHFETIGKKYGPFDLACIEIDGWNDGWPNTHLYPEEAVRVAKEVGSPILLPTHWAVFDLALHPWNESIQKVYESATENNIELLTPLMGEKVIPGETQTQVWW